MNIYICKHCKCVIHKKCLKHSIEKNNITKCQHCKNKDVTHFESIITKNSQNQIKIRKGLSILHYLAFRKKYEKAIHFLHRYYKRHKDIILQNKCLRLIEHLSFLKSRIDFYTKK